MCGAVTFVVSDCPDEYGVCHCEMCRRWTGSALLGMRINKENIRWDGQAHIARLQSSEWAERAWCAKCGSPLWFRVTRQSEYSDDLEIPIGLLDDPGGLTMTNEIYIDHKPDSFAYAGDGRKLLTRQDCIEKFGALAKEQE